MRNDIINKKENLVWEKEERDLQAPFQGKMRECRIGRKGMEG